MVVNLSNVVIIWRSSKSALKTLRRGPPERGQNRHYGIDFQTAENHLEHVGEFDGSRQMGIIGHGADFPESRANISYTSDRSGKSARSVHPHDYIHDSEYDQQHKIDEEIGVSVAHLLVTFYLAIDFHGHHDTWVKDVHNVPSKTLYGQHQAFYLDSGFKGRGHAWSRPKDGCQVRDYKTVWEQQ